MDTWRGLGALVTALIACLPFLSACGPVRPTSPPAQLQLDAARWHPAEERIEVETSVAEPDPYGTHRRVELSLAGPGGRELFRAVYCSCSRVDPVPPNGFGLYHIHEDGSCSAQDVASAGPGAERPATAGGFTLLPETGATRRGGLLTLRWVIAGDRPFPAGRFELRGRVVPLQGRTPAWTALAILDTSGHDPRFERTAKAGGARTRGMAPGEESVATELRRVPDLAARGTPEARLEQIRRDLMDRLLREGRFRAGKESYEVADIYSVYRHLALQPDFLRYRVVLTGDLPPERFLYLIAVRGTEHGSPPPSGDTWATPALDLSKAVLESDPWLVSAALFHARKTDLSLEPEMILRRWRSGPWDEVCTEQALLYLARRTPQQLAAAAGPGEGLPTALTSLDPVPGNERLLQPLPFRIFAPTEATDIWRAPVDLHFTTVFRDDTMEAVSRSPLELLDGVARLRPTRWTLSLEVHQGRLNGRSRGVRPRAGFLIRLPVQLEAGV